MPAPSHDIEVITQCGAWKQVNGAGRLAVQMVNAALDYAGYGAQNGYRFVLSILLADDAAVRALNHQFRGKDKPTNILSFPSYSGAIEDCMVAGSREDFALGDMILAFETVAMEANAQGKAIEDHLAHLCLHGALHLIGFDHENDGEAAMMEDIEIRILSRYRIANPYVL